MLAQEDAASACILSRIEIDREVPIELYEVISSSASSCGGGEGNGGGDEWPATFDGLTAQIALLFRYGRRIVWLLWSSKIRFVLGSYEMKSIAVFTNKGGVGKTTLLCNLAAFLSKKNKRVLIVDADPQANATQYMFEDDVIEEVYESKKVYTIYSMARPLSQGKGYSDEHDFRESNHFGVDVLLGDPKLALIEDTLATDWNAGGVRGIRTTFMFREMLEKCKAYDFVFFDMGPSLGSINRAVLIACDFFILPLSIDIFSVRATENISAWISSWKKRLDIQISSIVDPEDVEVDDLEFRLNLLGYVNQQYTAKRDSTGDRRPVKAYEKIMKTIPNAINKSIILSGDFSSRPKDYNLGTIPNLHSLVPMSQFSRKPIFDLKSSDGVVGAHFAKVADAKVLYEGICRRFIENVESFR